VKPYVGRPDEENQKRGRIARDMYKMQQDIKRREQGAHRQAKRGGRGSGGSNKGGCPKAAAVGIMMTLIHMWSR